MLHTPLPAWLAAVRPTLQPPVCNRMLYASPRGLQIMVVGGPNERSDFHVESGEELFLQLEGGMVLRVEERGALRDVAIGEGQAFLLPPHVPHSPQRSAGTLGLVLERARRAGDGPDGLRWYTADGATVLYEETFHCTDLATQLGPVIARFRASEQARTGAPDAAAPASPLRLDRETALGEACALEAWPQAAEGQQPRHEFHVRVARGAGSVPVALAQAELFLYLVRGRCAVRGGGGGGGGSGEAAAAWEQALAPGDTLVVPPASPSGEPTGTVRCEFDAEALCLMVHY
jgi:3-hydroxyanthranilate 3,4-dioxygenase